MNNTYRPIIATVTIAGVVYFFAAVLVLHLLRPEIDPVERVASNYAIGAYGLLMTLAFFAFGVSLFALAIGLYQSVTPSARSRIGLVLLGVAGTGLFLSGIFPTDVTPDDSPSTPIGVIHIFSGVVAFICLIVASLLWSRRFKQDPRWQSFARTSWTFAVAGLVSFIVFFTTVAAKLAFRGLTERILIALMLGWILLTAIRFYSITRESDR